MPFYDNTDAGQAARLARVLTNDALAHRLDMIAANRRAFDKVTTDAFLEDAARRLRWS